MSLRTYRDRKYSLACLFGVCGAPPFLSLALGGGLPPHCSPRTRGRVQCVLFPAEPQNPCRVLRLCPTEPPSPSPPPPKAWPLFQRNLVRIHGLQISKTIVVSLLTFFFF